MTTLEQIIKQVKKLRPTDYIGIFGVALFVVLIVAGIVFPEWWLYW